MKGIKKVALLIIAMFTIVLLISSKINTNGVKKETMEKTISGVKIEEVKIPVTIKGTKEISKISFKKYSGEYVTGYIEKCNLEHLFDEYYTVQEEIPVYKTEALEEQIGAVVPGGWLWNVEEKQISTKVKKVITIPTECMVENKILTKDETLVTNSNWFNKNLLLTIVLVIGYVAYFYKESKYPQAKEKKYPRARLNINRKFNDFSGQKVIENIFAIKTIVLGNLLWFRKKLCLGKFSKSTILNLSRSIKYFSDQKVFNIFSIIKNSFIEKMNFIRYDETIENTFRELESKTKEEKIELLKESFNNEILYDNEYKKEIRSFF